MVTGDAHALQQMRSTADDGRPVPIGMGPGIGEDGQIITRYADDYRGYRIRQYLWQGDGPVGRWFWQAEDRSGRIGETVLYAGAEREARKVILHDAMRAIDHMLDDPEWAEPVRNAQRASA